MDEAEFIDDLARLEAQLLVIAEELRVRKFYFRHFTHAQAALYACNNTVRTLAELRIALGD